MNNNKWLYGRGDWEKAIDRKRPENKKLVVVLKDGEVEVLYKPANMDVVILNMDKERDNGTSGN